MLCAPGALRSAFALGDLSLFTIFTFINFFFIFSSHAFFIFSSHAPITVVCVIFGLGRNESNLSGGSARKNYWLQSPMIFVFLASSFSSTSSSTFVSCLLSPRAIIGVQLIPFPLTITIPVHGCLYVESSHCLL